MSYHCLMLQYQSNGNHYRGPEHNSLLVVPARAFLGIACLAWTYAQTHMMFMQL